jgi:hypothetical protein
MHILGNGIHREVEIYATNLVNKPSALAPIFFYSFVSRILDDGQNPKT